MNGGLSPRGAPAIRAAHRLAWLILISISISVAIYMVVGLLVAASRGEPQEQPQLRIPFFVAALFLALGSFTFRRTQLRWIKLQAVAGTRGRAGLIKYLVNTTLVSVAMAELIGLLGLVLAFAGAARRDVVTLGIVALIVGLASYPRRLAWERTVDYLCSDGQSQPGSDEVRPAENVFWKG